MQPRRSTRKLPNRCCSGRSSFLASLGRMLAAEHHDVSRTGRDLTEYGAWTIL